MTVPMLRPIFSYFERPLEALVERWLAEEAEVEGELEAGCDFDGLVSIITQ